MIPQVAVPHYELTIPSNGKKITVRPFLVKEERLLLMAMESDDPNAIIDTVQQVLKSCIIKPNINLDTLPFFDVDYLFIALRAKSIGETIDVKFRCKNIVDEKTCGNEFIAKIDVANNRVIESQSIDHEIKIAGTHIVKLKYPNYTTMKTVNDNDNVINKKLALLCGCVEYIQQKDKVFTTKDLTKKDLIDFFDGLTQEQFSKFEKFVDNLPSFVITTQAKCNKCGFVHDLEYKDFDSFFV